MATLAVKYRPKSFDDVVEQSTVVEILKNMCEDKELPCRNFLLIGSAGCGKAQPLNSSVLTTSGYKQMRDIKVGDYVYTRKGVPTKVAGIFPQGERDVYEIELSDGTYIQVSDEHLNVVEEYVKKTNSYEEKVLTTNDLIKRLYKNSHRIEVPAPIEFCGDPVDFNYYFLGVILSCGRITKSGKFYIKTGNEGIIEFVKNYLEYTWNCTLTRIKPNKYQVISCEDGKVPSVVYPKVIYIQDKVCYNLKDAAKILYEMGYPVFPTAVVDFLLRGENVVPEYPELRHIMSYRAPVIAKDSVDFLKISLFRLGINLSESDREIPKSLLLSDLNHRYDLLAGLFDCNGYVYKDKGSIEWSRAGTKMRDSFSFLVRSLGIRDSIKMYRSSYTHFLKVPANTIFAIHNKYRKNIKFDKHPDKIYRNIKSIRYIGKMECQCIYVENSDHTYISDDFIPTHNTTLARIVGNKINGNDGEIIEIDAASNSGVEAMRDIVRQAQLYPVGNKWKVFIIDECHALSSAAWQSLLKTLEESPARSVFFLATTNPEKIPATILSRVQTFQLSKISLDGIENRLKHVISQENSEGRTINYTDDAINLLAKLANGGMRDALTLLDKVLAYTDNITSESLEQALNLPSYDDYFALLSAYASKDNTAIISVIHKAFNSGVNFVKWLEEFHSFVINIVKYIFLQDISYTMIPSQYQDKIKNYGSTHSIICLSLASKLVKLNQELKFTQYQQELVLTYLCFSKKGVK